MTPSPPQMCIRDSRAKWLRAALLIAVFALGVTSMTALHLVSILVGESFEKKLISYGANILVVPKQETLTVSYGGYALGNVTLEEHWIPLAGALAAIDTMSLRGNVALVAPKMLTTATVSGTVAAVVGVDWEAEFALKAYWDFTGTIPENSGADALVAGSALADKLGLVPGRHVEIHGQTLPVSAVLNPTGSDDDNVLFAPIALAQRIAGKAGQATFLEVAALCSGCPIEEIVEELQHALPGTEVKALRQVAESRMYAVHFAQNLAFYVSLVILVTACAMVVMSMLSSVAERRKEIGIMRAVGFSRSSVFLVFVTEALGIGILAGAAGYTAGHALAAEVLARLHLAEDASLAFNYGHFLAVTGLVGLVAGLAAAFPAWKASLVEPAEALVSI